MFGIGIIIRSMLNSNRPLSPHLTIYKLQISSALSILHRITGAFLFFGIITLAWLMIAILMQKSGLAFVETSFACLADCSIFELFVLGLSFCLYYHLFNGVRHLFWDIGLGLELITMKKTGVLVVVLSLLFTSITLYLAVLL